MAEKEPVIQIEVDDKIYEVALLDITGIEDRAFRMVTGMTVAHAFSRYKEGDTSIEPFAALVWLARSRENKEVVYEDILGSITYRDVINSTEREPSEEAETSPPE